MFLLFTVARHSPKIIIYVKCRFLCQEQTSPSFRFERSVLVFFLLLCSLWIALVLGLFLGLFVFNEMFKITFIHFFPYSVVTNFMKVLGQALNVTWGPDTSCLWHSTHKYHVSWRTDSWCLCCFIVGREGKYSGLGVKYGKCHNFDSLP